MAGGRDFERARRMDFDRAGRERLPTATKAAAIRHAAEQARLKRDALKRQPCPGCGGTGYRDDELRRAGTPPTDEEAEMLDTARCYRCAGDGRWHPA